MCHEVSLFISDRPGGLQRNLNTDKICILVKMSSNDFFGIVECYSIFFTTQKMLNVDVGVGINQLRFFLHKGIVFMVMMI